MLSNFFEKLPKDWTVKNFSDVAKITCGIAATPEYVNSEVGVPFLSARNVQNGKLDLSYYQHIPLELHKKLTKNTKPEKGDVLLTRVGAGIGQTAIVDIDFEFSIYVSLTLIKCGKSLDSEYVKSLLSMNYYEYLATRDQFAGGGVQNLNVQMVKNYPIPIPPIKEQKKIAEILSNWDKAIETVEKLVANSQQQKKALMQQLLTGQKRLLDENGNEFKEEWKRKSLKQLGEVVNGLTYSPSEVVTEASGTLVLRSSNIQNGKLAFDDNVFVNTQISEKQMTKENDILICVRNGSRSLIGKNALLKGKAVGCFHGAFMTIFRTDEPLFVYQLMQSNLFFKEVSKNLGATINSINGSDLRQFTFNMSTSQKEREKIAQVLTLADREIDLYQQQLDKLKLEKKALMQQLLTGQKRVRI